MIKIDSSVLEEKTYYNEEKEEMQSMIERDVEWFIQTVSDELHTKDMGSLYQRHDQGSR